MKRNSKMPMKFADFNLTSRSVRKKVITFVSFLHFEVILLWK